MFEFPVTAALTRKDVASILQILDHLANLAWHLLPNSENLLLPQPHYRCFCRMNPSSQKNLSASRFPDLIFGILEKPSMRKVVDLGKQIWSPVVAIFTVLGGIAAVAGGIYGASLWMGNTAGRRY